MNKPCADCTFLDYKACYEEANKLGLIDKHGIEYECRGAGTTAYGKGEIICPVPGAVAVEAPPKSEWPKTRYSEPPRSTARLFSDRCVNLGTPQGWIAEVKRSTPICESADDYVELQRWAFEKSKPGRTSTERREAAERERDPAQQEKRNKEFSELVKRKCPIEAFKPGDRAGVEREETFTIDESRGRRIKLACVVITKDGPCAWTEASALERIP